MIGQLDKDAEQFRQLNRPEYLSEPIAKIEWKSNQYQEAIKEQEIIFNETFESIGNLLKIATEKIKKLAPDPENVPQESTSTSPFN